MRQKAKAKTKDPLRCSFCLKTQNQVAYLISSPVREGPGSYICDECVAVCDSILDDAKSKGNPATRKRKKKKKKTDAHVTTTPARSSSKRIQIFYSYSHKDEKLRNKFEEHLSILKWQGLVENWHDRKIDAGQEWEHSIDSQLEAANIILLLVSSSFLASSYCYDREVARALERHDKGQCKVIPIILRPVDWSHTPFAKLQALPKDGKPIVSWNDRDQAFLDIAKNLRTIIAKLQS